MLKTFFECTPCYAVFPLRKLHKGLKNKGYTIRESACPSPIFLHFDAERLRLYPTLAASLNDMKD